MRIGQYFGIGMAVIGWRFVVAACCGIRVHVRLLLSAGLCALLAACIPQVPTTITPRPAPTSAIDAGVHEGASVGSLHIAAADAAAALASFRESCPRLLVRQDASGLTRGEDWRLACNAAKTWSGHDPQDFFRLHFEAVRVGDGKAYATGYYEPEIAGSLTRHGGYQVPVYRMPPDLVRAKPGDAPPQANGQMPLGRYDESGKFVAYYDRAQIDAGALSGKGLELAWVADPVEFFFLQVQGSGRVRTSEGGVIRIGYAGQNGLPYTGIGALMRERGLIGSGPGQYPGSMQGIIQYIHDHPTEGRALMEENRSWVFFQELTGDGPLGALNVPVRPESSVAADPRFVPLGAPVWLDLDRHEANGLWIAQDTGGAIKGANRFDTFWGAGERASRIAGGMSGHGSALILLPKGVLSRIKSR